MLSPKGRSSAYSPSENKIIEERRVQRLRLMDHVGWALLDLPEERATAVIDRLTPLFEEIAKIVSDATGEETEA